MNKTIVALSLVLVAAANAPLASRAQSESPHNAEGIIADLAENSMSAEEIRTTERVRSMRTVSLSQFAGQPGLEHLEETLRKTEDGFAETRTAIEANEIFDSALKKQEIPLSSVTAATIDDDGTVTIYTDMPRQ
jgi:hypothetical protein